MYETKKRTDFLFAVPSFLSGVATILDLFGTFRRYNTSKTPNEADTRAVASDWGVVSDDLQASFAQTDRELEMQRNKT